MSAEEAVRPTGQEEQTFGLTFRLEAFRDQGGPGAGRPSICQPIYTFRFPNIPPRLFEQGLLTFFQSLTGPENQEEVRIMLSNLAKADDQDQLMLLDVSRMHRPKPQEESAP